MSYRIYVTDLTQEIRSLMLALLRIKEQDGKLTPDEAELLGRLKSSPIPTVSPTAPLPRQSRGEAPK